MKLNLDFPITNLEGSNVGITAGKLLGQTISSDNKGNAIKLYSWALSFYRGETIEIDSTDTEVLEALIEKSETLTILAKAQLLNHIKLSKEAPSKTPLKKA